MLATIRQLLVVALLIGAGLSLAGCTLGKNGDNKGSIYKNPPSDSGAGSSTSVGAVR